MAQASDTRTVAWQHPAMRATGIDHAVLVERPPMDFYGGGVGRVYLRDPDGNCIELRTDPP